MTQIKKGLAVADRQAFPLFLICGICGIRGEKIFARLTCAKLSAPAIPW